MAEPISVFPPQWFVDNANASRIAEDPSLSLLSRLDPNLMALWHFATEDKPQSLLIVTGLS